MQGETYLSSTGTCSNRLQHVSSSNSEGLTHSGGTSSSMNNFSQQRQLSIGSVTTVRPSRVQLLI